MIVIFCLYLIYYTCCHFHSDNGEEVLMYVIFYFADLIITYLLSYYKYIRDTI